MSQTITINGEVYSDVPSIEVPLSTSGTASFYDIASSTVTADDMLYGVKAYTASGVEVTGTIATQTDSGTTTLNATTTSKTYAAGYYASSHGCSVTVYDGSVT